MAVGSASHSASPVVTSVSLRSIPHAVHLTVIDALPLQRVATDLRGLLRSTLEVMQWQAKACDVTLNVVVDDHVPAVVRLDAEKIAWATTVLVGNALRYVRHGTHAMPGGSIAVRVMYNSAGPEVTIEVQDDGAGIPVDRLPRLFHAGPDRPRVGLGLSMVREVVTAHAGHMEVLQQYGRTSTRHHNPAHAAGFVKSCDPDDNEEVTHRQVKTDFEQQQQHPDPRQDVEVQDRHARTSDAAIARSSSDTIGFRDA